MNIYLRVFRISCIILFFGIAVLTTYKLWQQPAGDARYGGASSGSLDDYWQLAQSRLNQDENLETLVTFHAVGDIMLSRNVAGQIDRNQKDSYWPFRELEDELGWDVDFNFGNLESPFTGRDDYNPSGSLVFNAPSWTFYGLDQYNFKVLNLANNHALDQGLQGLLHTRELMRKHNMVAIGAGADLDEAWRGGVYSVKGIRVGFIGASYTSLNDGGRTRNNYVARMEDTDRLRDSINELKTRADFIVVTMHAGTEYKRTPDKDQVDFARAAIDYGADMVIGAHPHWIQTIEQYNGRFIFYSLGNFVFDQMWSQDTREGLMLKISLTRRGLCHPDLHPDSRTPLSRTNQIDMVCTTDLQGSKEPVKLKTIELIPVIIENYGQPRIANPEEKQNILNKIGATTNVITP